MGYVSQNPIVSGTIEISDTSQNPIVSRAIKMDDTSQNPIVSRAIDMDDTCQNPIVLRTISREGFVTERGGHGKLVRHGDACDVAKRLRRVLSPHKRGLLPVPVEQQAVQGLRAAAEVLEPVLRVAGERLGPRLGHGEGPRHHQRGNSCY